MSIIENLKKEIGQAVETAVNNAVKKGELPEAEVDVKALMHLEVPKDQTHGDFACNIAMLLAKAMRSNPRNIAMAIESNLEKLDIIEKTEVAGAGFINFYLSDKWLYPVLKEIEEQGESYGKIDLGKGKKAMIEFVSANPTGPMHMGNARGGALGDCLASVLEYAGYEVTREFYINDAGNQIEKFGKSLNARFIQKVKGEDAIRFPEDGYQGEDIKDRVNEFIEMNGTALIDADEDTRKKELIAYALEKNVDGLKTDLGTYRIFYDIWFRESELHNSGAVAKTIERLTDNGYTYEEEGALWLNCEKMGLEKNEVLIRANGIPTYFAADIAYHINKIETRGYDLVINVWGADHHGHVARMKRAMEAVGLDSDKLEVVLMQLVRLMQDGEVVRMSKRTGKAITLKDLLEDVSIDVARFFFNMRAAGSHLDFDLDLAVEQSNENPVYYVQYAHARICSIIKLLKDEGIEVPKFEDMKPEFLCEEAEIALLKKLCEFPEEIRAAAISREPSKITRYVIDLATAFHSFYNACHVRVEDKELQGARLKLIDSVRQVISGILKMLKIDAPEKM